MYSINLLLTNKTTLFPFRSNAQFLPPMKTPYEILNIGMDANDKKIKQAYLQQVKKNPPDRDQEKFQLIHSAYNAIKDEKSRISHDLFTLPNTNFKSLVNIALQPKQAVSIDTTILKKILSVSIDIPTLLNTLARAQK